MLEEQWEGGFPPFLLHSELIPLSLDPLSLSAKSLVMHSCRVLCEDGDPQRAGTSCPHAMCAFQDTYHCHHVPAWGQFRGHPQDFSDISQDKSVLVDSQL